MKRFFNITGFFSGMIGGIMLMVFFFFFHLVFVTSLVLGIIGFAGAYIFLYAFKPKDQLTFNLDNKITPAQLEITLSEGNQKVKILEQYAKQITNSHVKAKLYQIIEIIKKIFENFKKDPKDIRYARQFLSYYMDTSIKIVRKYIDLSSQNLSSPDIQRILLKAENMLDSIEKAFEKQQAKLLRDDVMDLDVEIETLEKTFSAEDLK
jgi:5-bromo-4-chloroindolyl phosphate hydrolysis protein